MEQKAEINQIAFCILTNIYHFIMNVSNWRDRTELFLIKDMYKLNIKSKWEPNFYSSNFLKKIILLLTSRNENGDFTAKQ